MKLYPDAARRYIEDSGSCRTRASGRLYHVMLRQLQARHPDWQVDQFDTNSLTAWCLSDGPAPNTVKTRRKVARSFFGWAAWQKLVPASPAEDLKYTLRPSNNKVRHGVWLPEHELGRLLRACPQTWAGRRARILLMFGALMGLRREELAELRWDQVSHDASRLVFIGKGEKLAQLGIPPQLRTELQAWRREAGPGAVAVLPSLNDRFDGEPNWSQPIGIGGVTNAVHQAGRWAGLELAPHDLRRTFAGILEAKQVPVKDIARLMRHSNVGTTDTYLETNPARAAKLADTFTIAL